MSKRIQQIALRIKIYGYPISQFRYSVADITQHHGFTGSPDTRNKNTTIGRDIPNKVFHYLAGYACSFDKLRRDKTKLKGIRIV
ncbi:MAG: hypothetical protein ILP17_09580 [Lachnospiraceae bacterium]|nr:hypothetical protein [Lachnospiraceae bacterium]